MLGLCKPLATVPLVVGWDHLIRTGGLQKTRGPSSRRGEIGGGRVMSNLTSQVLSCLLFVGRLLYFQNKIHGVQH